MWIAPGLGAPTHRGNGATWNSPEVPTRWIPSTTIPWNTAWLSTTGGEQQDGGGVSRDIAALVRDAFQRATGRGPKREDPDAWWIEFCQDRFSFLLSDFGFHLERAKLHFRGNYVWYRSPTFRLSLEYVPDEKSAAIEIWAVNELGLDHPRYFDVPTFLAGRAPHEDWTAPSPETFSVESVMLAFDHWSRGLRRYAIDVLRGEWPPDAQWGVLW